MATVQDISERVLETVMDDSFDEDTVLKMLNDCATSVSRKLILPALDHVGTVETLEDVGVVTLPDNFQRNLYFCRDETMPSSPVAVLNSRSELIARHGRLYDSQKGTRVSSVVAVNPFLLYARIPTVPVTLTLNYQRKPDTLVNPDDEFDILPDGFEDIPYHYACWRLFAKIEQGLEGQKTDTTYHQNLYIGLVDELSLTLKEGVSLPPPPIVRFQEW